MRGVRVVVHGLQRDIHTEEMSRSRRCWADEMAVEVRYDVDKIKKCHQAQSSQMLAASSRSRVIASEPKACPRPVGRKADDQTSRYRE